jgi:hypothetical protein
MGMRTRVALVVVAMLVLGAVAAGCSSKEDAMSADEISHYLLDQGKARGTSIDRSRAACIARILAKGKVTRADLDKYSRPDQVPPPALMKLAVEAGRTCPASRSSTNPCKTEKATLETASEAFNAQADRYPTSIYELTNGAVVNGYTIKPVLKRAPRYWTLGPAHDGNVVARGTLPAGCA